MIDIPKAFRSWLVADATLSALVGTRVFVGPVPKSEAASMPRACVACRMSGGPMNEDYVRLTDQRFDVWCYGASEIQAVEVQRAVQDALKYLMRSLVGDVLMHSAKPTGAIGPVEDPDTNWPVVIQSFLVKASEQTAA